ncbi:TIR domain-containing protein [Paraburkholderia humisilvae]|uniref:TIR domain-containing protein n=1 Tax=Paraburkholderia humisilvae TaxID=627669 RepID=UPI0015828DFE|nr:TIR domain-containing protein [Paraburkholderia humisilvae]
MIDLFRLDLERLDALRAADKAMLPKIFEHGAGSVAKAKREKIRMFVISSAEAIPAARLLQDRFSRDPFLTVPCNQGVLKIASCTLDDIEKELDQCDFAAAIAHGDDSTTGRGTEWPAPRAIGHLRAGPCSRADWAGHGRS